MRPRSASAIEHRLFSFITINWRGKPLTELATIVNLIASTRYPQRPEGLFSTRRGQLPRQGHGLTCHSGWKP
jgi:hypothetical protein